MAEALKYGVYGFLFGLLFRTPLRQKTDVEKSDAHKA